MVDAQRQLGMVTRYPSRIIDREIVADRTLAFVVERPPGFTFRAGQYVDVTLPEPLFDDPQGPTRSFSVASAPQTSDLQLLMRMRDSAFKRSIADVPLGARVLLDGPMDDLSLDTSAARPLVFLAGGVGIAPFLGAVREAAQGSHRLPATLFYSNRRPEDAAYLDELCALVPHIEGFRCVPTMTRMTESARPWSGETERLGVPLLERYLPALCGPRYYLSGSTTFISGMVQKIERAGVPAADVRIEMYTGY